MCSTVAFILHFVQMLERFNGLNVGPTPRFDKISRMVDSLVNVIHSQPNRNKSMTRDSTYLKENNNISIYPKMLRSAYHDRYDKGVDCEEFHGFVKSELLIPCHEHN